MSSTTMAMLLSAEVAVEFIDWPSFVTLNAMFHLTILGFEVFGRNVMRAFIATYE